MQPKKSKIHFGRKSIILIAAFAILLVIDIATKVSEEAFKWKFTVIPHLITVESGHRNPGAAFSFLANAEWGQSFLIAVTFIMLAVLIAIFIFLPEKHFLLKFSVTMLMAGAVGNLIDRLAFRNVRDFVWVNMFGNWACCNFADFWIVFGVIIASIDLLFLNEWAVFPLTKKAREAQFKKDEEEKEEGTNATVNETVEQTPENEESKDNSPAHIIEVTAPEETDKREQKGQGDAD